MMISDNSERLRKFEKVLMALETVRADEVPAFAPAQFAEAERYYKQAQQMARNCMSDQGIDEALEEAQKAVERAGYAAERVRSLPGLAQAMERRIQMRQDIWARNHAPEELIQAEVGYQKLIRLAESGELTAVEQQADNLLKQYQSALLKGLNTGPVRNLQNQLRYAEELLPRKSYKKGRKMLARLERDMDKAQAGELAVAALRSNIAANGIQINRLLGQNDIFGTNSDFYDPGIGGWAPGTFEPPEAPVTMFITDRTDNSVTVRWRDRSGMEDENILERQEGGTGPWEEVERWGPLSGWQIHEDNGLQADTYYCYRVKARNSFGSNATPQPDRACAYTRDGNSLSLWRVQLRLRVADVKDAGTNNAVSMRLNSPLSSIEPWGNATWMDYGPDYSLAGGNLIVSDDFDRGREFTYDLNMENLSEFSDITMISFYKEGTDALGIAEFSLLVNGVQVFEKYFGETAGTCQWIDNGDGYSPYYTVFHSELRAHPDWQAYIDSPATAPFVIPNDEIVSRIEGMIGHRIKGTKLKWGHLFGSDWVQATRADGQTLHIDVDLEAQVTGPNPEVDIDFDLEFNITCDDDGATLSIESKNMNTNAIYDWFDDIITFGIVEAFDDDVEKGVKAAWQPIAESFEIPTGGLCPSVRVDPTGDVRFQLF